MKQLILIAIITLTGTGMFAQAPMLQWQKCLGGTGNELAKQISQTSDNSYIVCGSSTSNNGNVTGHRGSTSTSDCWVAKLNTSGTIIWQRSLGGSNFDVANTIQPTADGGYIMAGSTYSNDSDVTGNHGNQDYWVVKLNDTGTIQWQRSLGGTYSDVAYSIQQTADGGYIVAGSSQSDDGDVTVHYGIISNNNYWVVKLDDTGAIQWQKTLGGTEQNVAYSVQQTTDMGYIVAGYSSANDVDVTGHHGPITVADYWIVKLDGTGAIQWQRSLGGSYADEAYSIQQTLDAGYIVAGQSLSDNGDATGHHGTITAPDFWIVKLDDTGTIEWQRSLGGIGAEMATSVQQTTDHGYVVAGYGTVNDGDVTGNHGSSDFWIVKLDDTGTIEWQKCLGGTYNENATSVIQVYDGFVAAGWSQSNDSNVSGNHGNSDYWVIKLRDTSLVPLVTPNIKTTTQVIAIHPNPTSGIINITGAEHAIVKVYNTLGQLVKSSVDTDQISIAECPTGLYFVRVLNHEGEVVKQERIIKNL